MLLVVSPGGPRRLPGGRWLGPSRPACQGSWRAGAGSSQIHCWHSARHRLGLKGSTGTHFKKGIKQGPTKVRVTPESEGTVVGGKRKVKALCPATLDKNRSSTVKRMLRGSSETLGEIPPWGK